MSDPSHNPTPIPALLAVGAVAAAAALLLYGPIGGMQPEPPPMPLQAAIPPPPPVTADPSTEGLAGLSPLPRASCDAPEELYRSGRHLYKMPAGCSSLRVSVWSDSTSDEPALVMKLTSVIRTQHFSVIVGEGETQRTSLFPTGSRKPILWMDQTGSGYRDMARDESFGYKLGPVRRIGHGNAPPDGSFIKLEPAD
ncbi:MAG: hypothetical protein Alpg2KO_27920 [Alphaproteobacteria bacterium]